MAMYHFSATVLMSNHACKNTHAHPVMMNKDGVQEDNTEANEYEKIPSDAGYGASGNIHCCYT